MNRKQLVFLVVALVIVGSAGLMIQKGRRQALQQSGAAMGQKLFDKFPLNDVAQVAVTNNDGGVTLAKSGEQWVVRERGDFPANFTQISEFLRKVWELKVGQPIRAGEAQLGRLELLMPGKGASSGILVEFKDKDGKSLSALLLGKEHTRGGAGDSQFGGAFPDGRYVMVPGKLETVAVVGEAFSNVSDKPDVWLNKEFIKIENVRALAVEYPDATNSWKLTRESVTGEWKLADVKDGEELDKDKLRELANPLAQPNFNDVVPASAPVEETGLDQPTVITLETTDDFRYTIRAGKKSETGDCTLSLNVSAELPAERKPGEDEKPEDKDRLDKEFKDKQAKLNEKLKQEKKFEAWVYKVSGWTVDPILKKRSELLVEKPAAAEGEANAPASTPSPEN